MEVRSNARKLINGRTEHGVRTHDDRERPLPSTVWAHTGDHHAAWDKQ
jgi:hypothetical protein